MRKFLILVVMLVVATACMSSTRAWKAGLVINVSQTDLSGDGRSNKTVMHYTVETDDMVYFLDYGFNPASNSKNHAPNIAVNVPMKIAVEGKSAYILDAIGAEVKMHVVKKTKK
jgi:hypothetical protein